MSISYGVAKRVLKLHHPDSAEVAQIRRELAAGQRKTAVARAHRLGNTTHRLNRLLKKWAVEYPEEAAPAQKKRPIMTDAEFDALLAWLFEDRR
ncbi:MAG: hypothetical protein KGL39_01290 [Patescibacteria group bacterium]|nr:hypothetical protein [Patescibacteria group bacterium]